MVTALYWTREDTPRWDADKQRLFGPAELAATGLTPPGSGEPVADEWWHATNADDQVVGYGWLDSEWGDAEITFLVSAGQRGRGIGTYIVDRLEAEAAARGLNYIYNVVPAGHPDQARVIAWLTSQGFAAHDGVLRRRVRADAAP